MTTSKNTWVRRGALVLILGGGVICAWLAARTDDSAPVVAAEPSNDPLDKLATLNARRLEETRERLAKEQTLPNTGDDETKVAERFLDSAFVLHAARNMYNRDELQDVEYKRIAQDPAALALVRKVAVDVDAALEIYGQHQAFARTYAVRALGRMAKKQPEIAAQAVEELGKKLNQHKEWKKGIQHDYVDLLAAYSRALGPENILNDPESFMRRIQLTQRTSTEVERALWDSGIIGSLTPEQMTTLKDTFVRLSKDG